MLVNTFKFLVRFLGEVCMTFVFFQNGPGKLSSFQTMSTRQQAEKVLLGDPESAMSDQWLEATFTGADTDGIIPWAFKNRPQLPTNRQV